MRTLLYVLGAAVFICLCIICIPILLGILGVFLGVGGWVIVCIIPFILIGYYIGKKRKQSTKDKK